MKTPKIELKRIKTFRGMEGYGLNADVYVDGVKTCLAMDDATGGGMRFEIYDQAKYKLLEDYANSLPSTPLMIDGKHMERDGKPIMMKVTVEELIDKAYNDYEKEKTEAKKVKLMVDHLIWGVPDANSYTTVKFRLPLTKIPTATLQQAVDKYKATFKNGEKFLNTNLNALGINL